jgi:hypothetical protein
MDDAGLHDRFLPDGVHRVGQALEAVADQHAHVPHAAVLDLREDPQPELGALAIAVLPGPQAQHVTLAVHGDTQSQVDRPVSDLALPDLDVNGVDEHDSVNRPGSSGLLCHSAMPSITRSVIVLIVCFETSAP